MEENDEWKQAFSDADCMEHLLKSIPERVDQINEQLQNKLIGEEEQSKDLINAKQKKQLAEARVKE